MKVVKIKTNDGKERYYVADNNGIPIESVLKFIKFKIMLIMQEIR